MASLDTRLDTLGSPLRAKCEVAPKAATIHTKDKSFISHCPSALWMNSSEPSLDCVQFTDVIIINYISVNWSNTNTDNPLMLTHLLTVPSCHHLQNEEQQGCCQQARLT